MKSNEPPAPETAANRALLAASTLALGRQIDLWSLGLAAATLIVLFTPALETMTRIALLASLAAAGVQKFLALRTALDAGIFAFWARRWSRNENDDGVGRDLAAFDLALREQFPGMPPSAETRSLEARITGAKRLLTKHSLVFSAQISLLAMALAFHHY